MLDGNYAQKRVTHFDVDFRILAGMKTIAAVLALAFLAAIAVAVSAAEPDPCAKEVAAARRNDAPPMANAQLRACRNRQKAGTAPWRRDGGVSDGDVYVKVPCPPGMPPWRVCEKKRSEVDAGI
jgi:hypothetical protein